MTLTLANILVRKVCKEIVLYFYAVNLEYFARILYSRIALKDKFAR